MSPVPPYRTLTRSPVPSSPLWRIVPLILVSGLTLAAYNLGDLADPRVRSALGVVALLGVACLFSTNLKAVNWRVVGAGFALQVLMAVLILRVPEVKSVFDKLGGAVGKAVEYSRDAAWIFGPMGNESRMDAAFGPKTGIPFVITLMCTVVFFASFFSVLYHLRILQAVVWVFAKLMIVLMGKKGVSGAESLSAAANVFMGQTEAPLIIKPYVAKMTNSELLAVMIGGMATIAGSVMAIYIGMMDRAGIPNGAAAILATSVMAAPCGLYIAKILLPETAEPTTRGTVSMSDEKPHKNVVDAAASGASDGMMLTLNIVAMLIAFLALIALANGLLKLYDPSWSLERFFSNIFAPVAHLMGVDSADVPKVSQLLGIKLVGNEFLAFNQLSTQFAVGTPDALTPRSYLLTMFALTGFANIGSIGIQLGGIGAMAPERRGDLANLGLRALLGGFLATLVNAAVAGVLLAP